MSERIMAHYSSHNPLYNNQNAPNSLSHVSFLIFLQKSHNYYYLCFINKENNTQIGEVVYSCLYSEQVTESRFEPRLSDSK